MGACLAQLWTSLPHRSDSFFAPSAAPLLDAHGAKIGVCICECSDDCLLHPKEPRGPAAATVTEDPQKQHDQWCDGRNRQQSAGEDHLL